MSLLLWNLLELYVLSVSGAYFCQPLSVRPQSRPDRHPDRFDEPHPGPVDLHPPQKVPVQTPARFVKETQRQPQHFPAFATQWSAVSWYDEGQPCFHPADVQHKHHHPAARFSQVHSIRHRELPSDLKPANSRREADSLWLGAENGELNRTLSNLIIYWMNVEGRSDCCTMGLFNCDVAGISQCPRLTHSLCCSVICATGFCKILTEVSLKRTH